MKKVLSLILSLMLVFTMLPGALMVQATEYETVTVLTGGKDFSTVFSGSGTQLSGSGYTLQNVSSSFTSMAVKEKSEVSQTIADGVTSEKVLVLTPSGTANPTARFKGFTQTPGGSPIRIKFKMYLENAGETGTYHIQALPQVGTSATSASGGLELSDITANGWVEANAVVTPKSGVNVGGIKFTITKTTATTFPTTIYMDGNIVVETVKEVAAATPQDKVDEDKEALSLGDTSAVTENLTLPTVGSKNGSQITWATTNDAVVKADGTVIRPAEDTTVTLTATLSLEGATATKEFSVTVLRAENDADKVAEDKEALQLGDLSEVTENLTLPTSGSVNGSVITWSTTNDAVVGADGTIHRSAENQTATLTATITYGGASDTKEFSVTVLAEAAQDSETLLQEDKDDLDLGDLSAVTENLVLPTTGSINGSQITWATSNVKVIESNGTIHRSLDDQTATLTATFTLGNASDTKTFDVTVKGDTERFTVEWQDIISANFLTWTRYDMTTATKITYPARYGASSQNRMEFKYNGEEAKGTNPDVVYEVSKVDKPTMTAAHPAAANATGSGNYAKIVRQSNVGALFFKLNAASSVTAGDKVRFTFKIFPTDICLAGNTGSGVTPDGNETVTSLTYTFADNYASSATATKNGGYTKEITLIPNQWNTVVVEYTALKDGIGGFNLPIGYANYSANSYNTTFPATIYFDGDIKVEHGVVTEVHIPTPQEKADADKEALDLGDTSAVAENLTLPIAGSVNGSTITWVSSDTTVVENDGTIHRGSTAQTVTLTATITNDGATATKTFTVTVVGEETAAQKVALDKAALDLGDTSLVINNLTLPATGSVRGSAITWVTSDASIVEANGTIHRAESNQTATLTATISLDGASDTKEFTIVVKGTVENRNLTGVNGTYFHGGAFVQKGQIDFSTLFEGDGSNGTNGTKTFTPKDTATADKDTKLGLVAETTDQNGIKFKGWVADSAVGVNKLLLSKTYNLPEMSNLGQPYYVELEVDSQTRGVITYAFGNGNGNVLTIQKTDSRVKVDDTWKDVLDQEDYVFYVNGVEKARTDVVRKEVTTFGIYVIPELKQILIYQNGTLLVSEVLNYATEDTVLKDVTVSWKQSQGSSGIPSSSYLHLRNMKIFEGPALSEAECLQLDKDKFRFSLITDEEFTSITKDMNLVSKGIFGSDVKWTSSNNNIINAQTGVVTRDRLNTEVTLTAEIGPEGNSVTKSQTFIVLGTVPSVTLEGVDGTYYYDNTFYQTGRIEFGDMFEGGVVNEDGWAPNGTNGTVYVSPITTEGASAGEKTPGLYAKKTDANGIWFQSLVASAENNGQGLPIFEKTYTIPEITEMGMPYYIELSAEAYIRDSLTLSFGNKDNGVVEIEKLDQNEHAEHPAGKNIFVVRSSNMERYNFPYTYSADPQKADVKIGIYVIPQLKKVLVYKNGVLMSEELLDFSKKSSPIKTLTIKWEHSTVRTTLMQANFLHLKYLAVYEGNPLPAADRLTLDGQELFVSSFTDEKATQITKDLTLPTEGIFGCSIDWSVKDGKEYVINPQTGAVTRQATEENVTLVATISVDGQSVEKEFNLTIVKKGTDGNILVGSDVKVGNTDTIEDPSYMTDGVFETFVETLSAGKKPKITIDMGEEKLLSKVIIYERMVDGAYNIQGANLELSVDGNVWTKVATMDSIGEKKSVEFAPQSARFIRLTVTSVEFDKTVSIYEIEAVMSAEDTDIVKADASVLKAFDAYNVKESVVLPTTGQLGSTITWVSSNPDVVDNEGNVTRPSGAGANVTLTATVTYGEATQTISFSHYVEGLTSGGNGGGSDSGGSGGGGSSSGGSGNDKVTGGGAMNEAPAEPETPIEPAGSIFNDVEKDSWAYEYIEKLYTEKIMEGDGNGNFDPKRPILREEFLKTLLLALGVEIKTDGETAFEDVDSNAWYAPYVDTAYELGISNGMGDGSFGIGQTISRQDMAVLACRVAQLKGIDITSISNKSLTDINSVSAYAKDSVQTLANAGIISGDEYSIFNPEGNALREQAAKIICMLMELK